MLSAGSLTEVVQLQRMVYRTSESGEQRVEFEDFYRCRAAVKYTKTLRDLTAGEMWNPTGLLVTIRYNEKADACRRLLWRGKAYTMTPPNADRVNGSMTITAELFDEGAGMDVPTIEEE